MAKEVILEAVLEGERVSAEELAALPAFNTIPKEKHEKFPGAVSRRTFEAGQRIITQGEHGTTCFHILSGVADIFVSAPSITPAQSHATSTQHNGFPSIRNLLNYLKGSPLGTKEQWRETQPHELALGKPVGEVGAGDFVGELEALNALKEQKRPRPKFYPRAATVRATTDVVALEMLPNYLNVVLYTSPAFKDKLNKNYRSRAIEYSMRAAPVFRTLPEDLLVYLCSRAELADFEPDQVICQRGDEVKFLDLVRLGFVKLSQSFPGGELVVAYLSRNSYFGESGLLPALRVRAESEESEQSIEYPVSTNPIKVCRSFSAGDALVIPWDEYISRDNHAELSVERNQLKVVRRSAKNPIRYAGKLLDVALVSPGETFELGRTKFEVEIDAAMAGRHPATCTATDFVQLVRIRAEDFPKILEGSSEAAAAIRDVAQGRRQIQSQLLRRVQPVSLGDFLDQDLMQAQNLLLLDLDRCTRCDECVKACAATHADGVTRLIRDGLRFENYLVTTSCRACMDPLCMTHCPVGAIRRKGSNLAIVIEPWCIGCCNCAQDCPYGAINVMDLPVGGNHAANGSQGKASKPRAVVCDLCREYPEPNCVRACPHDAAIRVQPGRFFARELKAVQLTGPPRESKASPATSQNETKIFSSVDVLLKMIPRLELVAPPGTDDPFPPGHPRTFLLRTQGATSLGREAGNDCALQNLSVSRKHAIIESDGSRFILRNLSESNITSVNDVEVKETELHSGDVIGMGEVRLKFLLGQSQ